MSSSVSDINELKYNVKQLIKYNSRREVTSQTKYNVSGIYMIYIDNFTNDNVVPVYIGQSKDIQRRYKQHYSEILALNRFSYDEYERYFFSKGSSFYEGNFKSCKIFKYMLENNCNLQDYHMIILDEIELEKLEQMEHDYFRSLLPSFFGFNQLNSFLKILPFRFSNTKMNEKEINDYLDLIIEDIQGIHDYYEYGFTKFNFQHSMPTPRDINYLLKGKEEWNKDTLLKFGKVNSDLDNLYKEYKPGYDEMKPMIDLKDKRYGDYGAARYEYSNALDAFKSDIHKEFRKQKLYSEKAKEDYINSVIHEEKLEHKEHFKDYLKSRKCDVDFYQFFQGHIDKIQKKYETKNQKDKLYQEIADKILCMEVEKRSETYRMIFPSCQFESFTLGDNVKELRMEIYLDDKSINTCHINIYISNNALSRGYIRKDPDIIRLDYYYINDKGTKYEKQYYIENETTRNCCNSGYKYYEQDFYSMFAFRPEKFKVTSLIDNEQDNSFISILAEYKHGINDYTIRDKELVPLAFVFKEIQQLTDEETGFEVKVSESYTCLEKCFYGDTHNNPFVKRLISRKLHRIRKKVRSKATNIRVVAQNNKIISTRAKKYEEKIKVRSNDKITVFNYISSKEKVTAKCNKCSYEWEKRSDRLLARPHCPVCK